MRFQQDQSSLAALYFIISPPISFCWGEMNTKARHSIYLIFHIAMKNQEFWLLTTKSSIKLQSRKPYSILLGLRLVAWVVYFFRVCVLGFFLAVNPKEITSSVIYYVTKTARVSQQLVEIIYDNKYFALNYRQANLKLAWISLQCHFWKLSPAVCHSKELCIFLIKIYYWTGYLFSPLHFHFITAFTLCRHWQEMMHVKK